MKVMRKAAKSHLPHSQHRTHRFGTILIPTARIEVVSFLGKELRVPPRWLERDKERGSRPRCAAVGIGNPGNSTGSFIQV